MTTTREFEESESARAFDAEVDGYFGQLAAGLDGLLDISDRGDLGALGPRRLIEFAQRLEAHRTRLSAVDAGIVEAAEEERLTEYTCTRSVAAALSGALRITPATARARVARARQILPRNGFSSGPQDAELPVLASAVRSGTVTGDQIAVIGAAMRELRTNPQIGTDEAARAEQILVQQAAALGPKDLRTAADRIDEVLLPDGVLPREEIAAARRGLTIGTERRDGTHHISGNLTRVSYTRLMSVLSPLSAPRPADDPIGPDPRTPAQRLHDALDEAASRLLDTAGLPRSGGTPATVHVTVDADRLLAAVAGDDASWAATRAVAETSFGDRLTFGEVLQLAEQARIVPTYLANGSGILSYGTMRRCASEAQTQALIARDRGCTFPGCTAPPEWCERHHVIPWYRGGPTDITNLTLLCGFHHREHEKRGWSVVIAHGLPVWIPPNWIDQEQRPLINTRVHGATGALLDVEFPAAVRRAISAAATVSDAISPDAGGDADRFDPIEDLLDLLALRVDRDEREEFKYEIDFVLDGYIGPNAPSRRALELAG